MSNETSRQPTDAAEKDQDDQPKSRPAAPGRLELKKTVEQGQVRQSFSHGRSKAVTVEVKKRRTFRPAAGGQMAEVARQPESQPEPQPKPVPVAPVAIPVAAAPPPAAEAKPQPRPAADGRPALVLKTLTE